jgi:hypothetical protein
MEGLIGDIPWCIGYCYEKFGLVSLDDSYVGLSSTSPYLIKYRVFSVFRPPVATGSLRDVY